MAFKDTILTFEEDKIVTDTGGEVMMSWEAPIMEKSAEYICESKGDILEIGFGMGICSDYIQAQGVNSHTIVEIHPQIIEKLKAWSEDKDNVTIVEGDWNSVELGTYDGIFIDTFEDENWSKFKEFSIKVANTGAKITYWNSGADNDNQHSFDNLSHDEIDKGTTEFYSYAPYDKYYMPKVVM